jgi:hypothetical protein
MPVNAVEKRVLEIRQDPLSHARPDLNRGFRELSDERFGFFHLGEESAPEPDPP